MTTSNREYIDGFDIVIRMKDAIHSFQKLVDYQEHIGTKFDVLYTCHYCYIRSFLEKHHFQYIISQYEITIGQNDREYFNTPNIHHPELISATEEYQLLDKLYSYNTIIQRESINIFPSTGLFAIFHLLLFQPRELTIIGMDFYQEGGNMFKEVETFAKCHSGKSESELFVQLIELNKDRIKINVI